MLRESNTPALPSPSQPSSRVIVGDENGSPLHQEPKPKRGRAHRELLDWLRTALVANLDGIAAIEQGRLVSLSLELPVWTSDAAKSWRGDRIWLAPKDGAALIGVGAVADFESIPAARFKTESARWVQLGAKAPAPVVFFTSAPAPDSLPPDVCLPRVLLHRRGDAASITFSMFRDKTPVSAIAERWQLDLLRMSGSSPTAGGGALDTLAFLPGQAEWTERVQAATDAIAHGLFAKVVLARKAIVKLASAIDTGHLANRLAAACPECRIIVFPHNGGELVAASPELLAVKRGARVVSYALAGTATRSGGPEAEALAAERLFASPKERREHALVVEDIAGVLRTFCDDVRHAPAPSIMKLPRLQHLWTPVSGTVRSGFGLLDVVERLHPTPAVLGSPRAAAKDWLAGHEEHRDGLYTGAAGWLDLDGDGEAVVVLRSAFIKGRHAHLWAGAGIMLESDPAAEWHETELKMAKMLELLTGAAA